jgi:hypothetical protein
MGNKMKLASQLKQPEKPELIFVNSGCSGYSV